MATIIASSSGHRSDAQLFGDDLDVRHLPQLLLARAAAIVLRNAALDIHATALHQDPQRRARKDHAMAADRGLDARGDLRIVFIRARIAAALLHIAAPTPLSAM